MSYLVVMIVNDPDDCPDILSAWEEAGVLGVTILETTGLGRIRRAGLRDDISIMPSLRDLFSRSEIHNRTLLTVVEDREIVDRLVAIAQEIIGDLDEPHTGFLFVVPVIEAYGLGRHRQDRSKE